MRKSLFGLAREIFKEFGFLNYVFNRMSDREAGASELVSYYRPINGRGRDQIKCLKAHIKTWRETGDTQNYCHVCPEFHQMTCMESTGADSRECKKGHYRFEAT